MSVNKESQDTSDGFFVVGFLVAYGASLFGAHWFGEQNVSSDVSNGALIAGLVVMLLIMLCRKQDDDFDDAAHGIADLIMPIFAGGIFWAFSAGASPT